MLPSILLLAAAHAGDPAVEAHLNEVVSTLRAETPSTLSPEQRTARLDLLDLLQGYADAGAYPEHDGPVRTHARTVLPPRHFEGPGRRAPVFVDRDGTHCAVGYLMAATEPALVERIVTAENDAYVLEMTTPGIEEWAFEHGFSAEELAWIQPEYQDWPIDDCATFSPPQAPTEPGPTRYAEATLGVWGSACHACGGPLRVYTELHNLGETASPAGEVVVRLGDPRSDWDPDREPDGEVLATVQVPALGTGEAVIFDVIEVPGSLDTLYGDYVDVWAVSDTLNLPLDNARVYAPERGQEGLTYPPTCPEGAVDEGVEEVDDEATGGLRCSSTAAPTGGTALLIGLGALVAGGRRRRRITSPPPGRAPRCPASRRASSGP